MINKFGVDVQIGKWYDFMTLKGFTEVLQVTGFLTNSKGEVDGVKTYSGFERASRWLNWITKEHKK